MSPSAAALWQRWVDGAMFPDHFPGQPDVTVLEDPPVAEGPQPPSSLQSGGQGPGGGWGAGGTAVVDM